MTTLADQMAFGVATTTYVMPGITSATSLARQGTVTGVLTTDANGNLASDGGALEARVTALESGPSVASLDSPVTSTPVETAPLETGPAPVETAQANTGTVKSTGASTSAPATSKSVSAETIATTDPIAEASHVAVSENGDLSVVDRNNRGEAIITEDGIASNAQTVSSDVIGTNLVRTDTGTIKAAIPQVAQNLNVQDAASNLLLINQNTANITANRADITRNSSRIDEAFVQIGQNAEGVLNNNIRLDDLEQGLAAVAALPDMYLARGESMSASGGLGIYGDSVGFGGTIAVRGNDTWTFGASVGLGGDEATGKVQVRWAK